MVLPGARVGGGPPLVWRIPKKIFADAMVTGVDGEREAVGLIAVFFER
jgi:hypothetical protein